MAIFKGIQTSDYKKLTFPSLEDRTWGKVDKQRGCLLVLQQELSNMDCLVSNNGWKSLYAKLSFLLNISRMLMEPVNSVMQQQAGFILKPIINKLLNTACFKHALKKYIYNLHAICHQHICDSSKTHCLRASCTSVTICLRKHGQSSIISSNS